MYDPGGSVMIMTASLLFAGSGKAPTRSETSVMSAGSGASDRGAGGPVGGKRAPPPLSVISSELLRAVGNRVSSKNKKEHKDADERKQKEQEDRKKAEEEAAKKENELKRKARLETLQRDIKIREEQRRKDYEET